MPRVILVGAVQSTEVAARTICAMDDWELQAIVSLPAHLAHRHSDYVDLAPLCDEAGATFIPTAKINAPDTLDQIRALQSDLILVVGWSQLCGEDFRSILPGRVLGYHPAALPRLRGRAAIPWTILNGEPISGATIFHLEEGPDTGDIVAQAFFHVSERETAKSLYARHMEVLPGLVAETLSKAAQCDGTVPGSPQDDSYATYGTKRTPDDGRIDWTASLADIDRLIRAVGQPYPPAFAMLGQDRILIHEAVPHKTESDVPMAPGRVIGVANGMLTVATAEGILEITSWNMTGEKQPQRNDQLA